MGTLTTCGITGGITFGITHSINANRRFNVVGPVADFQTGWPCPTNIAPFAVTITWSEPVNGFDVSDLQLTNCTAANFTEVTPNSVYTVDLTPIGQGVFSMEIPAGVCTSTADGTDNARAIFRCTYDTVSPTVVVTGPAAGIQSVAHEVTITFDESVTGLVIGDLTVTGASADSLTGLGAVYTLTVKPTIAGTDVTVQVPATVCTDLAGNDNDASNVYTATTQASATQPAPTISGTAQSADQTWTLTVDFDQDVVDGELAVADFATTGGYTITNVTKVTNSQYTFDVTGGVIDVAGTVAINAGAVTAVTGGLSSVASNTYAIEWISFTPESLSQDLLQWCGE